VYDETFGQRQRLLKRLASAASTPPLGEGVSDVDSTFNSRPSLASETSDTRSDDGNSPPAIIVTSIQSLLQPVPSREELAAATQQLTVGKRLELNQFTKWLADRGCHGTTAVELPG